MVCTVQRVSSPLLGSLPTPTGKFTSPLLRFFDNCLGVNANYPKAESEIPVYLEISAPLAIALGAVKLRR